MIGGGFGGLLAGARLREAGIDDIRIDREGRRLRRHLVLEPLSGRGLRRRVVHLPAAARGARLHPDGEVRARAGDPRAQPRDRPRSSISTATPASRPRSPSCAGTRRARAGSSRRTAATGCGRASSCMANGPLHRPKLPGIPGIETFTGHSFHTSRWDYAYTGGDQRREPRPACTTSASASSAPAPRRCSACRTSARRREHLYVFQRTPSSIDVRANRPTDPEWAASLAAGLAAAAHGQLQHPRLRRFPRPRIWCNDGWTDIIRKLLLRLREGQRRAAARTSIAQTPGARRLREDGADPRPRRRDRRGTRATAEALKPYYRQFCKRPCFHDEYLETFNRPNVTLVDTNGKGVERITRTGVVVGGTRVRARLPDLRHRLRGRHRLHAPRRLRDPRPRRRDPDREVARRRVDAPRHCTAAAFPNCFIMSIAQSGFTVNFPHMLDEQAQAPRLHPARRRATAASTRIEAQPAGRGRVGARPSSTSRR